MTQAIILFAVGIILVGGAVSVIAIHCAIRKRNIDKMQESKREKQELFLQQLREDKSVVKYTFNK